MTRVLIFGTGSIGTLYAYVLWRAGASVVCVCRSNYREAKENGFTIRSTVLGDHTFKPDIALSIENASASHNHHFDYVIVCTKAFPDSKPNPAELIAPAIESSPGATIVLIQNGIGIEEPYAQLYPNNCIISAVTYSPSTQVSPVEIRHTESVRFCVGPFPAAKEDPRVAHFAEMVNLGGGRAETYPDIQIERWKKLVANATWNPICSLSRCRDVEFLSASPFALDCAKDVMQEVITVGVAVLGPGALDGSAIDAQLERTASREWPGVEPSMMSDMLSGKRMETMAIIGEVVRLARKHVVSIPRTETLYALVSALDWAIQQTYPGSSGNLVKAG
ncbi:hypothetical protein NW767_010479 [Fusarium falciforme]|nr:hypothetical protein NW767_010479 [Fusarium falciforme]